MSQEALANKNTLSPINIKWAIVIILSSFAGIVTYLSGLDSKIILFVSITSIALTLWAMELLPDALVACVLPVAYIVTGIGPAAKIMAPWTASTGWLVIGGFMIGVFMMKTGLARRIALHCMNIGGTFARLLWGIMLAGIVIAPFIPSVLARSAILAVICVGICEALKVEKGSREGAAIILTGFVAVAGAKLAFITGGGDVVMAMGMVGQFVGHKLTWMEYFIHNGIPAILYCAMSVVCVMLVFRPKLEGNMKEAVAIQFKEIGSISKQEKKALVMLVILLTLMMTDKIHGVDIGWIMVILPSFAFLPGLNLLEKGDFAKLNFPALIFIMGCMSIGSAAVACGINTKISAALLPYLGGSELYTITAIMLIGIILNFFFTPLAAYAAFTTSAATIAQELGIDPFLMVYALGYGLDQYIFPYEYAVLLYFFATGYVKIKDVMLFCAVRMLATVAFVVCIAYPYWKFVM